MSVDRSLVVALLYGVLVLAGCGDDGDALTATDPDARFDVAPGEQFSVILESNPSTGFAWALVAALGCCAAPWPSRTHPSAPGHSW